MAEISPPELRGSLLALEQLSIVLGVVFGFWTGFITRNLEGSASWRIPLGIQIGPGVILALGCLMLPPSPRWLVLKGRNAEALRSLAKLRMRPSPRVTGSADAEDDEDEGVDELLKIELLEMRIENELIHRRFGAEDNGKGGFSSEARAWGRLFSKEYRERTWIGVLIMFFQRELRFSRFLLFLSPLPSFEFLLSNVD
jgi:MFS family permease